MRLFLVIGLIALSSPVVAALWPMINSPSITYCATGGQGPCTLNVKYGSEGTMFVMTNDVIPPDPNLGLDIIPMGIHCEKGGLNGAPFTGCRWDYGTMHTPQLLSKCKLKSTNSWELTPDSTCFTQQAWGPHSGAAPGGECVMFVQSNLAASTGAQRTPIGLITPNDAANNGNNFCAKALPPSVTCELMAPSVIDLGVVRPGESSQQDDFGEISCGEAPKITKLVDGDKDFNGVKISVEPTVIDSTKLRINSTVTVSSDAKAGDYSATYVFIASPN